MCLPQRTQRNAEERNNFIFFFFSAFLCVLCGRKKYVDTKKVNYGLFACGVTISLLCFSVLLFRQLFGWHVVPATAYYFLAIPPVWFYVRSEYHRAKGREHALSVDVTTVLLSVLLLLYLIPYLLQILVFPNYSPTFAYYHYYALPALIASLMLIRLHAYGGNACCVFIGTGMGIVAFFFILTAIPVLSPVYYPISTATAAVIFSVFLLMMAQEGGLMKRALVRFGKIEDEVWDAIKQYLFPTLAAVCLLLFLAALFHPVNQPLTRLQLTTLLTQEEVISADGMLPQFRFFLSISLIMLTVALAFFYFEKKLERAQFRRISPVLWLVFALLLVYSICLSYIFYTSPASLFRLNIQILIWALVSFIAGRFLNLGLLWLWGIFLLFPFALPSIEGYTRTFVAFHPLTLACVGIVLSVLSIVTDRVPVLYEHSYSWPWARKTLFKPVFLFSAASQIVVYLVFAQAAVNISYRHTWLTVIGLFLAAIPALLVAHSLTFSRQFLFFFPYTTACVGFMLALQFHFPENTWLIHLKMPHLVACGLLGGLFTIVVYELVLKAMNRPRPADIAYRAIKYMAASGILLLILYVYFMITRDIDSIAWQRFLTSGILTLSAGLYFRYLIEDTYKDRCYAFFVGGVTLSMVCFSILIVKSVFHIALEPALMLWLLILPPLWFYLRSEYNRSKGRIYSSGRDASIALLSYVLALYIFPSLVRVLLFPAYSPDFFHYSQHAPLALVIGLLMIRLHALGGGPYLVFTGVVTNVVALFFLAVRLPSLILGEIPVQSVGKTFEFFTIISIFLSYFFLISTREKGILKKAFVKLGDIQDDVWNSLRKFLLPLLLGAPHLLFFLCLSFPADQQFIGIIFLFLAGLWLYAGYSSRNILLYSFAYIEVIAAIFSCRFFSAIWTESWIIWLLLGIFIGLILFYEMFLKTRYAYAAESFYLWLIVTAALVFYEHVTFYGFYSRLGILPLLILWIVVFFVPVSQAAREHPAFKTFLGALTYAPALFFFLQQGPPSIEHLPRTLFTAIIISCLIIAYRVYDWQLLADENVDECRIVHHLHWFLLQPHSLASIFFLTTLVVFVIHFLSFYIGPELFADQFFSLFVGQGILAVYWFDLARKDRKWWWTVIAEAMITGMIFSLRQGLPLMFELPWTVDWDMAVGLFAAFAITAVRPLLRHQDKSIRIPIRFTLFSLPLITVLYAFDYGVDFNVLSRVILLYSVIFLWQAYSEKDRFVLAYAFLGINSFLILLLLHNQIQSLQAYLTPVCISLLILVQIFRDITTRTTANFVRGTTLLILLGMAMFEAIAKNYTSPASHLILIALSILAIVVAVLLRIQIFALAGLLCLLVDIIAVLYIVLSQQETEILKVIVGLGLTVGGGLILSGYVLYRKNKEYIERGIRKLKETFYSWE